MTREALVHIEKGREFLVKARDMLASGWPDEAARAAYLAGFHAAQAFVLARTGRLAKSHSGLRSMFARLVQEEAAIDPRFSRFLARAYTLKEVADYGVGSQFVPTTAEVEDLLETAAQLLKKISEVLANP